MPDCRPERSRHDDIRDGDGWDSDLRCVCLHALGLLDQLGPVRVVIGADDGLIGPRVGCRTFVRQLVMMRGQARTQDAQQGDQACGRHATKIPREEHGTDDTPRTQVASSEVAPPAHASLSVAEKLDEHRRGEHDGKHVEFLRRVQYGMSCAAEQEEGRGLRADRWRAIDPHV